MNFETNQFFQFEQNFKSYKLREYYRKSMCFRKCQNAIKNIITCYMEKEQVYRAGNHKVTGQTVF